MFGAVGHRSKCNGGQPLGSLTTLAPALGEVHVKNLWMSVDPICAVAMGGLGDGTSHGLDMPIGE